MTVRIVFDSVNAIVKGANDDVKLKIQKMLSYDVDGGRYSGGDSGWDGQSTMFTWSSGVFPAGFARAVAADLNRSGVKCALVRKELIKPLGNPNPVVSSFPYNPDYAYQDETCERLVRFGGMIAQIATGGGKSQIACKAAARIGRMTLFITTRSMLMYQMQSNFQESMDYRAEHGEPWLKNEKVGVIGSGELKFSRFINVATVQTLSSFLSEPGVDLTKDKRDFHLRRRELIKKMLSNVSLLVLEEAHEASGESFYEIARLCKKADYRLALTATPFMKDSTEANMRLMAVSGRIEIKVSEKYLIDKGILAKPIFLYRKIGYVPDTELLNKELTGKHINFRVNMSTPYQKAYQLGITYNLGRNTAIVDTAVQFKQHGLSCMTLVRHERHGQILKAMLEEKGLVASFINGKSSSSTRSAKLIELASGKIDVLIGSTILDVGVDVPSVGAVIIAGGGKAEVELRQRVGRGLRKKKKQANICFIADFLDTSNKHLMSHSYERKNIIETTPGFAEGVIDVDGKFDFSMIAS
ncbi:ATP-dependent helicase [Klebsiella michiganensis]|uniref:DEAD/DEAH box helicase n=1 Tax=Klebsiella michiganensis TaxID=1134687 RepID=UPI000FEB89E8|nr:DEAD/DEAH box helicase [Klebsiella michiganensis]RWS80838.1 ATP-dependent helicase [Klebsiella michiganensis]